MAERLFNDDVKTADNKMENIIKALKSRDEKALKSLFSQKAVDEADQFDQSITVLFDFYKGDLISYSSDYLPISENAKNNGDKYRCIKSKYIYDKLQPAD